MTDIDNAGTVREALITFTPAATVAGVVREVLIAGTGLEGRIGTQSRARGSVNTTTAGLVLGGSIAAQSKARAAVPAMLLPIGGRIGARSAATSWVVTPIPVAGRIRTMSSARLLPRNSILVAARATTRSKARGLVYLTVGARRAQWGTTINTG